MTGLNVDPLNAAALPTPATLRQAGFTWVRMVSRPGVEPYSQQCQDAGLAVMAVVARESNGFVFGGPDLWQFGNEPDAAGPSSWTMSATEYRREFNFYQATYPQLTWIAAGLASGQPSYWQDIKNLGGLTGVAGFAVHPYNKTAYQALNLLMGYRAITPSLGLWVTEWHRPESEVADFGAMLRQTSGVIGSAWFAAQGMVDGFGLSDTQKRRVCL